MSTPPGPDGLPPGWQAASPSPEFLAALKAEIERRAREAGATGPEMLTPLQITVIQGHTLFQAATTAGFTDRQAIIFAVEVLTHS